MKSHRKYDPIGHLIDDLAVIDGVLMKGRRIILAEELQQQELEESYNNHMGIKMTRLLLWMSIHWLTLMQTLKIPLICCSTYHGFQ